MIRTCDACGRACVQPDGWTDVDANAEAAEVFGVARASERADMARVCDDCYREIMQWVQDGGRGARGLRSRGRA